MKHFEITTSARGARFATLRDWDGEYMGVSRKHNNGDWDYWLVLEAKDLREYGDDFDWRWVVSLKAVSPEAAGEKNVRAAESCMGIEEDLTDPIRQVEALAEYGVFANLYEETGNNRESLLREARKQAAAADMLFGFYMDRAENLVGATGWDVIAGNLTPA